MRWGREEHNSINRVTGLRRELFGGELRAEPLGRTNGRIDRMRCIDCRYKRTRFRPVTP